MLRLNAEDYARLQATIQAKVTARPPMGAETPKQKRSKYGNEITHSAGKRFDSKAEAQRWHYLSTLAKAGEISELKHHVSFDLLPAQHVGARKELPVRYEADFTYIKAGKLVVEDVKSAPTKTREFVLKRKMMLWIHKIAVIEVMATS